MSQTSTATPATAMESPKLMVCGRHRLLFEITMPGRPIGSHEGELGAEVDGGGLGAGGGGGRTTEGECRQAGCRGGETIIGIRGWKLILENTGSLEDATIGGSILRLAKEGWSQETMTMSGKVRTLPWIPDGMWGVRTEEDTWGGQGGELLVGTGAGCLLPMIGRVLGRQGGASLNTGG